MDNRTWQPETDSFSCLFSIVILISVLYKVFNISNWLLMARMPKPPSVSVVIPGPSSVMSITSTCFCKDNRIMISPSPRGAIPCFTAFSTNGCISIPGISISSGLMFSSIVRVHRKEALTSFRKSPVLSAANARSRSGICSLPDWPNG